MEAILDNAFDAVVVVDREGIVRYVSQRFPELYGRPREEALGRPADEVLPHRGLPEVARTGRMEIGVVRRLGGRQVVINRYPLKRAGELIGAAEVAFLRLDRLLDLAQRLALVERKLEMYRKEVRRLWSPRYSFKDILGESPAIAEARRLALRAAHTDLPVLLVGETGTGKELFAQAIHRASPRGGGDFVAVNCAAIPGELLEAELFGYERGAFTGAYRPKPGRIELADGGTLFLDEIADMPLPMQAKLLRVLETKEVEPVGGLRPRRVDFRLICATHEDLQERVARGRFREDLFWRINALRLEIPPLRERPEDILPLAEHFLARARRELHLPPLELSEGARRLLMEHSWPGNVRELRNLMECLAALVERRHVEVEDVKRLLHEDRRPSPSLRQLTLEAERRAILHALRASGGRVSQAARLLGVDRSGLYKKLRRHGLRPSTFRYVCGRSSTLLPPSDPPPGLS